MQKEIAWGTAAALAVVAAVGISSQPGSKQSASSTGGRSTQTSNGGKPPKRGVAG